MAVGLKVWDASGNLMIDVTDRLMRFLGYVIIPAGSGSGSVTNDGILTGVPFAIPVMFSSNGSSYYPGDNMYPLNVWFSGNQMFWTINAGQPDQIVQYGVR